MSDYFINTFKIKGFLLLATLTTELNKPILYQKINHISNRYWNFQRNIWSSFKVINSPKYVGLTENYLCIFIECLKCLDDPERNMTYHCFKRIVWDHDNKNIVLYLVVETRWRLDVISSKWILKFFAPRWIRTRHLPILPFSVPQMTNTTILSDTDDLCVDR